MSTEDILTQEQIDALLAAIHTGDAPEEVLSDEDGSSSRVRIYDFRHPSKFSREHLQTLQAMHEIFARLFSTTLSAQMRLLVQIDVASVDQLTYEEFLQTFPNPTASVIFTIEPLLGSAVLEFHPTTAMAILDRLLGGPGRMTGKNRELTDIESSLLSKVASKGMDSFAEAWKSVVPGMIARVHSVETNPRFVQITAPSDTVVVVTFDLKIGENQGAMRICIPYPALEPVMGRMSTEMYFASARVQSDDLVANLKRNLDKVEVRLSMVLGYTDITVRDLITLQEGDVVTLDSLAYQDLPVMVERDCKFFGRPGLLGNRLAVQITQVVAETD